MRNRTPHFDTEACSADVPLNIFAAHCRQVGVDEVGIGPLAGPVVAAAVLLDVNKPIAGLNDSKKLSAKRRQSLSDEILERALSFGIGWANETEIDKLNILKASHLAMRRAVAQLKIEADVIFVDGNKTPDFVQPCVAVVKGDRRVPQISAASIIAKVARDSYMLEMDLAYPQYGFAKHMGYPTKMHVRALQENGACPIHRRSFRPVAQAIEVTGSIT